MMIAVFDPGTPPGPQVINLYGGLHDGPTAGASLLLLVKDADATHSDPTKDQRGCYKRGDIIGVLPPTAYDGNVAANPIGPGRYLLRVSGVTPTQAVQFQRAWASGDTVTRRRRYRIDIDALPAATQTSLTMNRYAEISWAQVRARCVNKETSLGS